MSGESNLFDLQGTLVPACCSCVLRMAEAGGWRVTGMNSGAAACCSHDLQDTGQPCKGRDCLLQPRELHAVT